MRSAMRPLFAVAISGALLFIGYFFDLAINVVSSNLYPAPVDFVEIPVGVHFVLRILSALATTSAAYLLALWAYPRLPGSSLLAKGATLGMVVVVVSFQGDDLFGLGWRLAEPPWVAAARVLANCIVMILIGVLLVWAASKTAVDERAA